MGKTMPVYGVDVPDMVPEGYLVSDVIVLAKVVDAEGESHVTHAFSDNLTCWEAMGMARMLVMQMEHQLLDGLKGMD